MGQHEQVVPPRLAAVYLALQGIAVPGWWVGLALWPAFRGIFELGERDVLQAFLVPDVAFALASLTAAGAIAAGHRTAVALAGITVGAVGYSTVMTVGVVVDRGQGAVGAVAMVVATVLSAVSLRAVAGGNP